MTQDINILREVRRGLRDIRASLTDLNEFDENRAIYQIDCLRALLDTPPERREPWSYYAVRTAEEFDE